MIKEKVIISFSHNKGLFYLFIYKTELKAGKIKLKKKLNDNKTKS